MKNLLIIPSVRDIHTAMNSGYLRLLQAFDPLFPVGAFTMSNGMETYVQKNLVRNRETLSEFLDSYLYILPYNDLGFAAKSAQNTDYIFLDVLFGASKSPAEPREGSKKMCARFVKTERALGNCPLLKKYAESIENGECTGFFPVAAGLFITDTKTDIITGLEIYCYSILSCMVNHAVKLVPMRQLDGQQCLSRAIDSIPAAVKKAVDTDIQDLGINGTGFDLRSMQHEKLYSRLYIS